MTKDDFDEYNKNRACTLENMVKRYGEEDGLVKWESYCERQHYTTSLDYFQKTYGIEEGSFKYEKYIEKISLNVVKLNQHENCKTSLRK